MRIQVYQINSDRDKDGLKFMSRATLRKLKGIDMADASLYDEVFDGDVECANLEEIFRKFNNSPSIYHAGHPLFRGHSITVSDVIVMNGRANCVQPVGFNEVEFDVSKTQKPDDLMRVVFVEPMKAPVVAEVRNNLAGLQQAVDGLIEPVYFEDGTVLVCNEEGKLNGMQGNRRIGDGRTVIAGPFFICGDDGENFKGLTDEEVEKYMNVFKEPEEISQAEVEADMGFTIISGM